MSFYLRDVPLAEAQASFREALADAGLWAPLQSEVIALDESAVSRVTAEPVWARISSPHFHAAAMDGFAVRADDTQGAQPATPVVLKVHRGGGSPAQSVGQYVDTGDPLPDWANAVVPIENTEPLTSDERISPEPRRPHAIRLRAAVAPWSHVRPLGEDLVATQLVLPSGHTIRPVDLGAIASAGYSQVAVVRRPRVAVIPTGSELIPLGSTPQRGEILEFNSLVIAAKIAEMGGQCTRREIVKDDLAAIRTALQEASASHDLVLINAGSSAGSEDYSAAAISGLGLLISHGVAVRPGHPVVLGLIRVDLGGTEVYRPVIGVPGYPVSAALTIDIFVEPLLAVWLGRGRRRYDQIEAKLTRKVTSPPGDEDYLRVSVGKVAGEWLASPLSRGAGVITSLVQADGIVTIPAGVQGLEAGEGVKVGLYRRQADLENTILCIGSHDIALDLLDQFLRALDRRLVSSNVGSQGGLIALGRGYSNMAGTHLLDAATGEYNVAAVRHYLPGRRLKLVALARREQGLIVVKSNPKKIGGLEDLTRKEVTFINRQRGAGTRVLLDYHLAALDISPETIHGYNEQEYTHLGVAAAVASGRADCGLGIAAAAQALELEFLPLFKERYDLVIPLDRDDEDLVAPLFELLHNAEFGAAVSRLPGYDMSVMGTVILEDP